MQREVHAETDNYRIEWDSEVDAVIHTWKQYTSGEEFREGANETLAYIRDHDVSKLIVDTSGITAHDAEDQQWIQEEWTPQIIQAGIRYSAMVHPESAIAKMDIDSLMEKMDDVPHDVYVTDDMDEALDWIDEA